jgi:hypothetical protein
MLDEIVLGSILLIAAGLTVMAYRYPTVYKKFCIPLIGFVAVVWIAQLEFSTGYSMGSTEEQKRILELNNSKQISLPKAKTNASCWPVVAPALIFYMGFLGLRRGLRVLFQRGKEEIEHHVVDI